MANSGSTFDAQQLRLRAHQIHQSSCKRSNDLLGALLMLLVALPLVPVLYFWVKVDSPGPFLYTQWRIGRGGKPFRIYKIRTMVLQAEAQTEALRGQYDHPYPVFKHPNDPRVTRLGAFLRRTSVDEWPQLINVLRGEMSLVGPRPHVAAELALYQPMHQLRLLVRPGLTCIWQVAGRHAFRFEEWMHLDLLYLQHSHCLFDLGLILRTLWVVWRGQAY